MSNTVLTWELGMRLRQQRDLLGYTAEMVGAGTGMGGNNLSAIEKGKRPLTSATLGKLLEFYDLPSVDRRELEALHGRIAGRDWWEDYAEFYSADFLRYIGLEAGASLLQEYSAETVPGLLQTEAYARAMIRGGSVYIKPLDVGPRVESRMARQAVLDPARGNRYVVVMNEAALHQEVGGPAVMTEQLDQLIRLSRERRGQIRLHVMPYRAGAHPLTGSAVQMLSFSSKVLPDMIWTETVTSGSLTDERQFTRALTASFAEALDRALDPSTSVERIEAIRRDLAA